MHNAQQKSLIIMQKYYTESTLPIYVTIEYFPKLLTAVLFFSYLTTVVV